MKRYALSNPCRILAIVSTPSLCSCTLPHCIQAYIFLNTRKCCLWHGANVADIHILARFFKIARRAMCFSHPTRKTAISFLNFCQKTCPSTSLYEQGENPVMEPVLESTSPKDFPQLVTWNLSYNRCMCCAIDSLFFFGLLWPNFISKIFILQAVLIAPFFVWGFSSSQGIYYTSQTLERFSRFEWKSFSEKNPCHHCSEFLDSDRS